jgi:hypothetical protein
MSDNVNTLKNTEQVSTQLGSQMYYETTACMYIYIYIYMILYIYKNLVIHTQ